VTPFLAFAKWAYKAAVEHEAIIGLLVLAFVITMRAKLPNPFCNIEILEWWYEWIRDAMLAFVNLRSPSHSEVSEHKVTEPSGKVTESISAVSHGETPAPIPPDPPKVS